uniref:Uncharacterized protein n=1 Tax=Globisporangium ultimum (strain ATCC 200006 / CBS 805.95 / DAOM BR144) TaxID=431595 RepID=K3X0R3_GLOUD
ELIREVTCESPECGLLLLRVRDELRLTIESYQTLYHNSISYGRKKAVQAEAGIADLETDIQKLEYQREELEAKKNQLTHDSLFLEEQMEEERRKRSMQQTQIVQFLQTQRVELE